MFSIGPRVYNLIEPYDTDVDTLTLSPANLGTAGGAHDFEGLLDFGDRVVKDSADTPGKKMVVLTFTGKLVITLTHDKDLDPEKDRGIDGLVIGVHERTHAAITKRIWNDMVAEANSYEGAYSTYTCHKLAAAVVGALRAKARAEIGHENIQYDVDQYGAKISGYDLAMQRKDANAAQDALSQARIQLEGAEDDFRNAGCSKP